jgi:hypothetical protein
MNRFTKFFLVTLCAVFFYAHATHAATLSLSPASGAFEEGTTFTVGVYVSSADQAMNAASGVLSFPADALQVISLSKSGSIANLWVQEPSYSNLDGTVTFEGVVLNPGFQGASGKMIDVRFRVRRTGSAAVSFSSGSVLANDGAGTNILSGMSGGSYILKEAAAAPVTPPPAPSAPSVPKSSSSAGAPSSTAPTEVIAVVPPPVIRLVEASPQAPRGPFRIEGQADPRSVVSVYLRSNARLFTLTAVTGQDGAWYTSYEHLLPGGVWQVTARAENASGTMSEASDPVIIKVPSWFGVAIKSVEQWGSIALVAILIVGLLFFLLYMVVHRLRMTHVKLKKELWHFKGTLRSDLKKLQRDLGAAKRAGATVDLTPGKLQKMRADLSEEVTAIEKDIAEEITALEDIE